MEEGAEPPYIHVLLTSRRQSLPDTFHAMQESAGVFLRGLEWLKFAFWRPKVTNCNLTDLRFLESMPLDPYYNIMLCWHFSYEVHMLKKILPGRSHTKTILLTPHYYTIYLLPMPICNSSIYSHTLSCMRARVHCKTERLFWPIIRPWQIMLA